MEFLNDTPMHEAYARVGPRPADFPRLLDKIGEAVAKDFDFSDEFRALQVATLIAGADADMAPPAHDVEMVALLGGGLSDGGWMGEGRPEGVTHSPSLRTRLTTIWPAHRSSRRP